jgi:hypothetical protein
MMFDVQPDVPMPPPHRHRRKASKWPFERMAIGDSFLVADPAQWDRTQQCASIYGRRLKRKFTTRKMDDGLRVWRVA